MQRRAAASVARADRVLEREDATPALRLVADKQLLLGDADHDTRLARAADDGREDDARRIVTRPSRLAHPRAVVDHQGLQLVGGSRERVHVAEAVSRLVNDLRILVHTHFGGRRLEIKLLVVQLLKRVAPLAQHPDVLRDVRVKGRWEGHVCARQPPDARIRAGQPCDASLAAHARARAYVRWSDRTRGARARRARRARRDYPRRHCARRWNPSAAA